MSLLKKRIASTHTQGPPAEAKRARASPPLAHPQSDPRDVSDADLRLRDTQTQARAAEIDRLVEAGDWRGVAEAAARFEADPAFDGGSARRGSSVVSLSSRDGSPVEGPPSAAAQPSAAVAPPPVPSPQELIEAASGLCPPSMRSPTELEKARSRRSSGARRRWHEREALRRRLLERERGRGPTPTGQRTQEGQEGRQERDKQKAEEEAPEPEDEETPEPPKPPSGLSALETLASVSMLAPPNRIVLQPTDKPDLTSERRRKEAERLAFKTRLAEVTKEAILRKMREAHATHEYHVRPPQGRAHHANDGGGCLAELALRSYAPVRSSRARAGSPAVGSVGSLSSFPYEAVSQGRSASPRSASPRTPKASAEACYVGERHPITGLRHGRGVMAYPNGCKYVGEFKDDKRHGFGKVWYPSANPDSGAKFGGVYEGSWVDNQKSGRGRMEYANGDVYEGQWSNDQPNGRGTLTMRNGESYAGSFVDQKKHGFGVYCYPNGEVCEGTWREDECERRWQSTGRCLSRYR